MCGDGTVVSFELRRMTWLSWTEHSKLGGLAREFSGTENVFELSKELRNAAKDPKGSKGAPRRIAPAEVVPTKLKRGKKPPRKKPPARKAPAKKPPAKKAPTKKGPTKKPPAR